MTSATTADDAATAPLNPAETDIAKLLANIDPQQLAQLLQQKATPVTLDQALQTMNGSVIELAEDARVVIGGTEHGLWIGPKGGLTPNGTRLTNWVAFRSTKHAVATITDKREARIVNDTTQYLVTLIREDGRRFTTPTPMSAADSVNPMKMLVALDAGVPATGLSGSVASAAVTTMLMTLGYEERGQSLVWRRAGWLQTPEQPSRVVLVEPYSTMTADGPVEDLFVMEEDLASDNFLGSIGASADHAERTIRAFLAVTPDRLDLSVLGLGAIGASALGLDQRTTLTLVASPGSAKTVYLDCLSRWASAPGRGRKFSMDLSGNSISAGAIQMTISVIGTVAFADDARFTSPAAFTKFEAIAQNAYQSRVDSKLRIDGSKRDDKYGSGQAVVIATTESAPENEHAEALNSRVVWSPLLKGDVDISDGGGVDAWLQLHAQDANRLRGAYLQWLVRQAEAEGLEAFLKRTNASTAEAMHRLGASRQTQVVAILLAGWEWFTRFLAEEANLDIDTIVTPEDVETAFKKALDGSTEVAADSNPAASILERVRTAVQGFNGHVRLAHSADGSNRPNSDLAKSMGWNLEDGHWRATGETLGLLNLENDTLLLTGEGIEWAQKKLGMQSISKGQVHQGLADLDFVLNRGGTKRPAPSWGFNRQPGAIVHPSWLVPNYDQLRPPKPSPDDKF